MSKPRWQHDCEACEFLGPLDLEKPREDLPAVAYDVYWCPSEAFRANIVLRYADDGPDYVSSGLDILATRVANLRAERYAVGIKKHWDILWWKAWWFLVEQKKVKNWAPE